MPEHPPCLTPILKHKSSSRSALILFKWIKALSVNVIAGDNPSAVGAAGTAVARIERGFPRLRLDRENRKEIGLWGKESECFEWFEKRKRDDQFVEIEVIAIICSDEENPNEKKENNYSPGGFLWQMTLPHLVRN